MNIDIELNKGFLNNSIYIDEFIYNVDTIYAIWMT
jgi:hypothetical protein